MIIFIKYFLNKQENGSKICSRYLGFTPIPVSATMPLYIALFGSARIRSSFHRIVHRVVIFGRNSAFDFSCLIRPHTHFFQAFFSIWLPLWLPPEDSDTSEQKIETPPGTVAFDPLCLTAVYFYFLTVQSQAKFHKTGVKCLHF